MNVLETNNVHNIKGKAIHTDWQKKVKQKHKGKKKEGKFLPKTNHRPRHCVFYFSPGHLTNEELNSIMQYSALV